MVNAKMATAGHIGTHVLALTAGLGAGAGMMYLFDPSRGRSRRDRLGSEASGLLHKYERKIEKRGKDLLHRAQGAAAEAVAIFAPEEQVSDDILADRVRSRMGHLIQNPHAIEVHARNGVITLEGKLAHAEKRRLREEVGAIPGVVRVRDSVTSRFAFAPGMLLGLAAGLSFLGKARKA